MNIYIEKNPNISSLKELFETCFNDLKDEDSDNFTDENSQSLNEWFKISDLPKYINFCNVILAKEAEKLVGGAIVGMQNPLSYPDGNKYELFILGVLPEYRNKGLGAELVKECEVISKDDGCKSILVNTHELMTSTINFYKKLGYSEIGLLKNYYDNGGAVFFKKDLV